MFQKFIKALMFLMCLAVLFVAPVFAADFKDTKRKAEAGNAYAQYNLGVIYDQGYEGVKQNKSEAAKWFLKAAKQGLAEAQFNIANMYYHGKGVPKNRSEAAKWWCRAAEQGVAEAQYNLGFIYGRGEGVKQNIPEATRWSKKAAQQGHRQAKALLKELEELEEAQQNNYFSSKKDELDIAYLKAKALAGSRNAQHKMGNIYYKGDGVRQNYSEAAKWYCMAAEQDYPLSQLYLGSMYLTGEGVQQSDTEAFKWYQKAAQHDVAQAQFNLGLMYGRGEGVEQNLSEAIYWMRKAAEQGFPDAQRFLKKVDEIR